MITISVIFVFFIIIIIIIIIIINIIINIIVASSIGFNLMYGSRFLKFNGMSYMKDITTFSFSEFTFVTQITFLV